MRKNRFALSILACMLLSGCTGNIVNRNMLPNGYYTAEMADFDEHGWKEFVSIHVNNGRIVTVEYNAKNASGFIKSWDPDYMRVMNAADRTYPNEYTRIYATALVDLQDPLLVDAISGATTSYHTFIALAGAALEQARAGSKQIALVKAPAGEL